MEASNQRTSEKDYPVAYALNRSVLGIILMIVMAEIVTNSEETELHDLNRAYVLVVNELEILYERNPKLAGIKPEPIWRVFDVLKTSARAIYEYLENPDNDMGQAHNARVEKISIIAGVDVESPNFTPAQKKLFDNTESIRKKYGYTLDALSVEWRSKRQNSWQIPEYTLTYKLDGTLLINDVLRLKKIHTGSTTERLLEQAIKNPNTLFKPDLGQTARNISTVLNSAGFTATLRQLFFPTVSASKGVVFRNSVTRLQADSDNIDTKELDLTLKDLGAATEPKSGN